MGQASTETGQAPTQEKERKVFTEDYVVQLRNESAGFRVKAKEKVEENAKLKSELNAIQSELSSAKTKNLKYEIAASKNIPLSHADRLQGTNKEEIEADAEAFAASLKSLKSPVNFDAGVRGQAATKTPDMDSLIRAAAGR